MRHEIELVGISYRIRPVQDTDAGFILDLRSNPILNKFIHQTASSINDQLEWLKAYYQRQGDYYFVIEELHSGNPEGVISVYDIDYKLQCGEWGRWIVKPGSLASIESAWLIYECAFKNLGLREIFCRTVAKNGSVVSFHDSCGIKNKRVLQDFFTIEGQKLDAVEHRLDSEGWSILSNRLMTLARMINGKRTRNLVD